MFSQSVTVHIWKNLIKLFMLLYYIPIRQSLSFNSAVFIWKLKLIVNFEITIIHILPVR